MLIEVFSDGSCHNDGSGSTPMGAGGNINFDGETVLEYASPSGFGTSPKAEWEAFGMMAKIVDTGMSIDFDVKGHDVIFYTDNLMVSRQVKGLDGHSKFIQQWRKYIRHYNAVKNRARSCRIVWIPREKNTIADSLATLGRSGVKSLQVIEEMYKFVD